MSDHYLKTHPDKNGWFGEYGGTFPSPELEQPFAEISAAYDRTSLSADFQNELKYIRETFSGAPDTGSLSAQPFRLLGWCQHLSET